MCATKKKKARAKRHITIEEKEEVRVLRALGHKQPFIAERIGTTQQTISRILKAQSEDENQEMAEMMREHISRCLMSKIEIAINSIDLACIESESFKNRAIGIGVLVDKLAMIEEIDADEAGNELTEARAPQN